MRQIEMKRETRETQIRVVLDLDGTGNAEIRTGIAFFDHMLHACVRHGRFDLRLRGTTEISPWTIITPSKMWESSLGIR